MSEIVDVHFEIEIEDYRADPQAVYDDWRDDPRWDALTAFMDALFPDCEVTTSGKLVPLEGDA
jgi:hypothetical protein